MSGIDDETRTDPLRRASRLPMRYARPTTLLGLMFVLVAVAPTSCNSKAVGIDECRRIEYARCEAAVHCPENFDVDDVAACKRFYRDQCLHGLDRAKTPDKTDVTACVEVIDRLGSCAKKNGEDSLVTECSEVSSTLSKVDTVCELLKRPEAAPECAFITKADTSDSDDGSGGEAGSSGSGRDSGGTTSTTATAKGGTAGNGTGGST